MKDLEDGVQNELVEGTFQLFALVSGCLGPLLSLWVKVILALFCHARLETNDGRRIESRSVGTAKIAAHPETLHQLVLVHAKLLGELHRELANGKGPTVKT